MAVNYRLSFSSTSLLSMFVDFSQRIGQTWAFGYQPKRRALLSRTTSSMPLIFQATNRFGCRQLTVPGCKQAHIQLQATCSRRQVIVQSLGSSRLAKRISTPLCQDPVNCALREQYRFVVLCRLLVVHCMKRLFS
jgi:hypothetical protein